MRRIQGWDPILIISQIISLQTIHYLVLSLLIPPVLQASTNPQALEYAGGPRVTSYILDWREIASRSTAPKLPRGPPREQRFQRNVPRGKRHALREEMFQEPSWDSNASSINATSTSPLFAVVPHLHRRYEDNDAPSHYAVTNDNNDHYEVWDHGVSYTRGWVLAGLWVLVSVFDIIPLYYLVRKPTLILDFACTLVFLHICITTYHTGGRVPTSFFFWAVMAVATVLMIVGAEQLCVRREMNEGLGNVTDPDLERLADAEAYELDDR
ncbi:hypothetical protein NCC49_002349 [Naganishia albida]|nr:hypothetical protein NCC49_002349 [Naganishia albida]